MPYYSYSRSIVVVMETSLAETAYIRTALSRSTLSAGTKIGDQKTTQKSMRILLWYIVDGLEYVVYGLEFRVYGIWYMVYKDIDPTNHDF